MKLKASLLILSLASLVACNSPMETAGPTKSETKAETEEAVMIKAESVRVKTADEKIAEKIKANRRASLIVASTLKNSIILNDMAGVLSKEEFKTIADCSTATAAALQIENTALLEAGKDKANGDVLSFTGADLIESCIVDVFAERSKNKVTRQLNRSVIHANFYENSETLNSSLGIVDKDGNIIDATPYVNSLEEILVEDMPAWDSLIFGDGAEDKDGVRTTITEACEQDIKDGKMEISDLASAAAFSAGGASVGGLPLADFYAIWSENCAYVGIHKIELKK